MYFLQPIHTVLDSMALMVAPLEAIVLSLAENLRQMASGSSLISCSPIWRNGDCH